MPSAIPRPSKPAVPNPTWTLPGYSREEGLHTNARPLDAVLINHRTSAKRSRAAAPIARIALERSRWPTPSLVSKEADHQRLTRQPARRQDHAGQREWHPPNSTQISCCVDWISMRTAAEYPHQSDDTVGGDFQVGWARIPAAVAIPPNRFETTATHSLRRSPLQAYFGCKRRAGTAAKPLKLQSHPIDFRARQRY